MNEPKVLKPDGSVYEHGKEDDCPHENIQEIQGAGPVPLRTVCVDCGKEF